MTSQILAEQNSVCRSLAAFHVFLVLASLPQFAVPLAHTRTVVVSWPRLPIFLCSE